MSKGTIPHEASFGIKRVFPDDFVFGTATASYQIEGAVKEDGRCASIWDNFSHNPGRTVGGDNGDIADDSYHRWREDLELLKQLGVGSYRFSVAMPRIMPSSDGSVNEQGLDYYDRLIDGLLECGIKPTVTLYHWDLPQWIEDKGGWLNRDTAYLMADYAAVVARRLGNRVDTWTTLNEPWCTAYLGYGDTVHAPGLGLGPGAFEAVHNLNLAHGLMVQAIRHELSKQARCSVTLNLSVNRGDADAVHRSDLIANRVWLGPMLEGRYPNELFAVTQGMCDWAFVKDSDFAIIHQPIDVLGVNYYSTNLLAMSDRPQFPQDMGPSAAPGTSDIDSLPTPGEHTEMGWNIDPDGLYDLLIRLSNEFPEMPLMVTENGIACKDELAEGGAAVHDAGRIDYVAKHLDAVWRAREAGADVRGYFVWSLLDNFEWAEGYSKRFGLVYVDYETMRRVPKDSFWWYRDLIAGRSI